ncbi:hypothetical protein BS47DRAFT_527122 [Hydnum rufescens UP504]|uniref:Rho-GAP domain-containing protein n=1 Tax=Hydnum rufescens UP504 TaxID=1448309 RepID=A0A9P6E0Q8_9AGAM|nr:hypothetical protein BS47DRAFT_527122 [Hydnum rufescens UP504]
MLLAHPLRTLVFYSRPSSEMSLKGSTNASGGSDGNAVISDTALTSKSTSSSGDRHGVHRVKRVFPGMKRPLGPPGVIPGRAPKSEESHHNRSLDDGDGTPSTRNPSTAPHAQPLISTAVPRSSESNYSRNNPVSPPPPPPLPLKPSNLRASKSQHFATTYRKSDESFPSSRPSDPSLEEHAKAGRHPQMAFQFPRPSTKSVSSASQLSTFLRPSTPLALRSRFERQQGDAPLDSAQIVSIGPKQEHYEQDSSSPLAPISELSNTSRPGPSQRRSISLTDLTETFKLSNREGSVPSGDGTKFPTLGSSETSTSRHGVSSCTPIEYVSPPKGHQKGRVSATGSSPSALTTPRLLRMNAASLAHRRFDSTPIRDRAASASSIPVVRSLQSISVSVGATPEHTPRHVHHHHNLSALGAAGGIARDLGRKGWDRVERLWSGTNNSSPPRFGGPLHDGSREGGRDGKPKSHSSDASLPLGHIDGASSSSTDYGVCLPICLRPSSSNSGGLLFGRNLSDAVAATKITNSGAPWLDEKGRLRGTNCPALVVRCIQHLELWGVQEEGIFRITGRSTHVAKLRSEFDSGADYDLRQASPSDLDPHSVSSIFKAFFRELPEPILTHALVREFEDVMVEKTDSLGDSGSNLQTSADTLIADLRRLLARLPPENWFILQELCRLLKVTAAHYKTTKMPLSNLVLVFCPSLNMNPSVLRILVEVQEDIFVDSASSPASLEDGALSRPPRRNSIVRRPSSMDLKLARAMSSANSTIPRAPLSSTTPVASRSPSLMRLSNNNGNRGNRPKHMHNISLPLLTRSNSLVGSNPSPEPVSSQSSTPLSSEEHLVRPRTPASLRTIGALLGSRSRSNTNASLSADVFLPSSFSRPTSMVDKADETDADQRDRSRSHTLPKLSLHIPGGGTGFFFSLNSPGSGSRRTSWSDRVMPLPPDGRSNYSDYEDDHPFDKWCDPYCGFIPCSLRRRQWRRRES